MAVSDDILQLSIRHQIDLARYSNGLVRDIGAMLSDAERELIKAIIRRGANQSTFTAARLRALLAEIGKINATAYKASYAAIVPELNKLAQHEAESAALTLERAIPVKLDIVTPNVEQLKLLVSDAPIQGHLLTEWWASLETSMAQKVTQQIRLGVILGEPTSTIVRRLTGAASDYERGIFAIVRRQTEAIVRTSVAGVANAAAQATYSANGDIIKGVQWCSSLDSRTTPICQSRDGKTYPLNEGPRPPAHVNCRSFITPVLKTWKEMGIDLEEVSPSTRASLNGQVPADLTYGDWIKKQDAKIQNEALGVTRARLLRSGELEIQDFVNNKGVAYTLKDLKERQQSAFAKVFGH